MDISSFKEMLNTIKDNIEYYLVVDCNGTHVRIIGSMDASPDLSCVTPIRAHNVVVPCVSYDHAIEELTDWVKTMDYPYSQSVCNIIKQYKLDIDVTESIKILNAWYIMQIKKKIKATEHQLNCDINELNNLRVKIGKSQERNPMLRRI